MVSGFTAITLWWKTFFIRKSHWVGFTKDGKSVNLSARSKFRFFVKILAVAGLYGAYVSFPSLKNFIIKFPLY